MEQFKDKEKNSQDERQPIMKLEELPDVLNAYEISDFIGLSKRRVYELMAISNDYGGIPCLKIGKSKRVLKSDFIKWMETKKE